MCNSGHKPKQIKKLIFLSPLITIHSFSVLRSHGVHQKERDLGTPFCSVIGWCHPISLLPATSQWKREELQHQYLTQPRARTHTLITFVYPAGLFSRQSPCFHDVEAPGEKTRSDLFSVCFLSLVLSCSTRRCHVSLWKWWLSTTPRSPSTATAARTASRDSWRSVSAHIQQNICCPVHNPQHTLLLTAHLLSFTTATICLLRPQPNLSISFSSLHLRRVGFISLVSPTELHTSYLQLNKKQYRKYIPVKSFILY